MDIPFARKTLEFIELHREDGAFNMSHWARRNPPKRDAQGRFTAEDGDFCRTSACIAGQAVLLDPQFKKLEWVTDRRGQFADNTILQDGTSVDIETRGRQLLGLSENITNSLFYIDDEEAVDALRMLIERVDAGQDPDAAYEDIMADLRILGED